MAITAQNLMDRARQRVDAVGSTFFTDSSELLPWCSESYKELYDLMVDAYEDYFLTAATVTATASTATTALPTGFNKLRRMDVAFDGIRVPLKRIELADQVLDNTAQTWDRGVDIRYNIEGTNIRWNPIPSATTTVNIFYIPLADILTATSTAIATVAEQWAEYIVVDLAIKMRTKEESDAAPLLQQKLMLKQRILESAPVRDAGQARSVVDVRSNEELPAHFWLNRWW